MGQIIMSSYRNDVTGERILLSEAGPCTVGGKDEFAWITTDSELHRYAVNNYTAGYSAGFYAGRAIKFFIGGLLLVSTTIFAWAICNEKKEDKKKKKEEK